MYTPAERERIRAAILARAREDPRITGGALTGSASVDLEDDWSDIDLAFGVRRGDEIPALLDDWTAYMRSQGAVDHYDVVSGAWTYRVFLMPHTLQVDLAFAPASDFRARAATFRLVFGGALDPAHLAPPSGASLIGVAWLYALHVRSSLARRGLWQAEYMLGAMRDFVLSLACLRHGLSTRDGRGLDKLPSTVLTSFEGTLLRRLDRDAIGRAFDVLTDRLVEETRSADAALGERLEPVLRELTVSWRR